MFRVVASSKISYRGLSNVFCSQSRRGPVDCIDKTSTGVSFYDDFLDPQQVNYLRDKKNLVGEIEYLTPNQYYEFCARMFGTSVDNLKMQRRRDADSLNYLSERLQHGQKFDMPYVNFAQSGQEGLHRMMVIAEEYGWNEYTYPVLVVNYADARLNEVQEARKELQKCIDESLEYKYVITRLPEDLIDEIQYQLDANSEFSDVTYEAVIIKNDDAVLVLSLAGFESDIQLKIDKEDIQLREDDSSTDELDFDDIFDEDDLQW